MTNTPTNTEELRALAEVATPGPWKIREDVPLEGESRGTWVEGPWLVEDWTKDGEDYIQSCADAAFIAAANPTAILALLDEIDQLRASNFELQSDSSVSQLCFEKVADERDALKAKLAAAQGLRPEVLAFAQLMEAKLRENDHKPGWKGDNPRALGHRLVQETKELLDELNRFPLGGVGKFGTQANSTRVGNEAADVANFAMMIADICGALSQPPKHSGG